MANITTINITNSTSHSIPAVVTYSLVMPFFFAGITLLIVIAVAVRTRRFDLACLAGTLASLMFTVITLGTTLAVEINGAITLALAVIYIIALAESLNKNQHGNSDSSFKQ